jgi:S2P endopeptidase
VAIQCFDPSKSDNVDIEDGLSRRQRRHCLNAKDVVELNKCGEGRVTEITKGRHYVNQNPLRSSLNAIISSTFSWIFLFVIFFS